MARPLYSERMELIPAGLTHIVADLESPAVLADTLGVYVPEGWPPGEYDRDAMSFFKERLVENSDHVGWYSWYGILRPVGSQPRTLVCAAGYFGPPDRNGIVEIGYSVVPAFYRQGIASETVRLLVAHAFSLNVTQVIAHTAPENTGSIKVLERCGFRMTGPGSNEGTVQYVCQPPTKNL